MFAALTYAVASLGSDNSHFQAFLGSDAFLISGQVGNFQTFRLFFQIVVFLEKIVVLI